ncbi:MAG: beta-ketoacyl-ACP synthase III [Myxococcota bacterium]
MTSEATIKATASRIGGTGHYVPEKVVTNTDLSAMVDTSDQWIRERTGIVERRIAGEGESTSDMAAEAARRALDHAGLDPQEVDLVLVATVTPDRPLPSTAIFVHRALGLRHDCAAFDLAAACAGFIYGISIGNQYICNGAARNVLVIGVELLSRVMDWSDRNTCVLFGDGAGAVVLSPSTEPHHGALLSTHLFADGTLADSLTIRAGGSQQPTNYETVQNALHFVHMDGREIFKFAVRALASASSAAIEANGVSADEVDWVVPHQANLRILDGVSKRCGVPIERFFINIDKYGNTSSASVPIALDEAVRAGLVKSGQLVLMCALGGGIAWGSAMLRW